MHITIRGKLFALSSLGLVLVLALALVSWRSTEDMGAAMAGTRITATALRNHLEGDMMHDALRADVLAALLASPEGAPQIQADVQEHAERFRRLLRENEELALPGDVQKALADVKPTLATYIAKAEEIVGLAARDKAAAKVDLPKFLEAFETLEGRMEEASDLIQKSVEDAEAAALASQARSNRVTLVVCVLALLALGVGAVAITRSIVRPLTRTVEVLEQVAAGDLTSRLEIGTQDEIGRMARALNHTVESTGAVIGRIDQSAQALLVSSRELTDVSSGLRASASETAEQSNAASASAVEISRSIQEVAEAARQMIASVEEISVNTSEAASVSMQAVTAVEETDATMQRLDESSAEIARAILSIRSIAEQTDALARNAGGQAGKVAEAGAGFAIVAQEVKGLARETSRATEVIGQRLEAIRSSSAEAAASVAQISGVVKMIGGLAAQTNLLALNATIEAGRAASAGSGVGDMAREVKGLAQATATASTGIGQRADGIRADCEGAVRAVRQIGDVVRQVNEFQRTIASAVTEQSAVTQDIGVNVTQVAEGTSEIARSVNGVAIAAEQTVAGAERTQSAAQELAATASSLSSLVARFKLRDGDTAMGSAAEPLTIAEPVEASSGSFEASPSQPTMTATTPGSDSGAATIDEAIAGVGFELFDETTSSDLGEGEPQPASDEKATRMVA